MYHWVLITFILFGTTGDQWHVRKTIFYSEKRCIEEMEKWEASTVTVEQYHKAYCIPELKKTVVR